MSRQVAASVIGRALEVLYPARCVRCGAFGAVVCGVCEEAFEAASGEGRCGNCAARWSERGFCPRCAHWRWLDGGVAAFELAGPARDLVHALKYLRARVVAPVMAGWMVPLRERLAFDAVFSVPLHASRRRRRGFNQAQLLLHELRWPQSGGRLSRVRKTKTQVGMGLADRRANVAGAFAYAGPSLAGRRIALVDDVVTSGATMNECAGLLKEHGAKAVFAVSFARASYVDEHELRSR
jgi:ComF family protein